MPVWILAAFWGGIAGSALLVGAAIGYFLPLRQRIVAGVMAFGSGVLISAISFDLIDEAYQRGGFTATAIGFLVGAIVYTGANWIVNRYGAAHRKRSVQNPVEEQDENSGTAIAIGALIDGIPESIVIGLSLLGGTGVSVVAVAAVFISNIPEGLSSSAGMKQSGRSRTYIFSVWTIIALLSAGASLCGALFFEAAPAGMVSMITAVAAGAILCMIVDTMIPEAFAETHNFAGIITVLGFLAAFALEKMI